MPKEQSTLQFMEKGKEPARTPAPYHRSELDERERQHQHHSKSATQYRTAQSKHRRRTRSGQKCGGRPRSTHKETIFGRVDAFLKVFCSLPYAIAGNVFQVQA